MNIVKFTRDCLALGEHRESGSIAQLPEKTCRELIVEGAAFYVDQIETATMPTESNEKAVVKTGKRK